MKYVYQDCKRSCILACLASIAEVELSYVKALANREAPKYEKELAELLGVGLWYYDDTFTRHDLEVNKIYLISVPSLNKINGTHRIIMKVLGNDEYAYHDPAQLLGRCYAKSGVVTDMIPDKFWNVAEFIR